MIISLCGKSGSGKSTIAKYLQEEYRDKVIHLDIDKIGHYVLTFPSVQKELIKNFGDSVVNNNEVNRKNLGKIVFNSKEEMDKLTEITWKYMQIEIDKVINENNSKIIVLDWLLLPITKYFSMSNIKVLLDVPYQIRLERALKRDNINEETFKLREKANFNYDKSQFDLILEDSSKKNVRKLVKFIC